MGLLDNYSTVHALLLWGEVVFLLSLEVQGRLTHCRYSSGMMDGLADRAMLGGSMEKFSSQPIPRAGSSRTNL